MHSFVRRYPFIPGEPLPQPRTSSSGVSRGAREEEGLALSERTSAQERVNCMLWPALWRYGGAAHERVPCFFVVCVWHLSCCTCVILTCPHASGPIAKRFIMRSVSPET